MGLTVGSLVRGGPGLAAGLGKGGVGADGVADRCDGCGREVRLEDWVGEDGVEGEGEVAWAVGEVGRGSGEAVVAAAVARVLGERDDEAGAGEVLGQVAIGPWGSPVAVGEDDERESFAGGRRVGREIERVGAEAQGAFGGDRGVKDGERDRGGLDGVVEVEEATASAHIHLAFLGVSGWWRLG